MFLEHLVSNQLKRRMKNFDDIVFQRLGDLMNPPLIKDEKLKWTPYEDDDETPRIIPDDDEIPFEFFYFSLTDGLLNLEVLLY